MVVTNKQFGYKNLFGPQVYPIVRKSFSNRWVLAGYVKYVYLGKNLVGFGLDEREIGAGLSLVVPLKSGKILPISMDYSSLKFLPSKRTEMETVSFSLSVGLGF